MTQYQNYSHQIFFLTTVHGYPVKSQKKKYDAWPINYRLPMLLKTLIIALSRLIFFPPLMGYGCLVVSLDTELQQGGPWHSVIVMLN